MAKLIISRRSEFINALSDYSIYLNGEKIGTIAKGVEEEIYRIKRK